MKKFVCLFILSLFLCLPTTTFAKTTRFLGDEFYFDMLDVQNYNVVAAMSANNPQGFRFFNDHVTGMIIATKTPGAGFPNFISRENWQAPTFNIQTWKENIQAQSAGDLVSLEELPLTTGFIYVIKKEFAREKYYNIIAQKIQDDTLYVVTFSTTEKYLQQSKFAALTIIKSITPRKINKQV